ncbi:unnamed protein product [Menidia menidia]|uniref:(Atlantic silverside) hypothetical protein n=1 Tax=Menidia menidia TaxID=238744 RepID=A0A8S4BEL6_9TELE|nr:unnamed protein product [Menidia menidia]
MVVFQRKPFLYIINLIMPLLFLLVLDLASFFIGEARGEKLNFKVTVLLWTERFAPFLTGLCRCQSSDCSYSRLFTHLNISSSNEVLQIMRPVKNWTSATVVQLHLQLFGILDVYWTDEFLTWNTSEFCGIDFLTVPRSILWIPDIAIQEDTSDVGTVLQDPFAVLYPSGLVKVSERKRLTYICQLDLFLFPFDHQRCNMTFESMSSDGESLQTSPSTCRTKPL